MWQANVETVLNFTSKIRYPLELCRLSVRLDTDKWTILCWIDTSILCFGSKCAVSKHHMLYVLIQDMFFLIYTWFYSYVFYIHVYIYLYTYIFKYTHIPTVYIKNFIHTNTRSVSVRESVVVIAIGLTVSLPMFIKTLMLLYNILWHLIVVDNFFSQKYISVHFRQPSPRLSQPHMSFEVIQHLFFSHITVSLQTFQSSNFSKQSLAYCVLK